jgi:hypothetical protein
LSTAEERNRKNTLSGEHLTSPFERSGIVKNAKYGGSAARHRSAAGARSPEPIPHALKFRMPRENNLFEVVRRSPAPLVHRSGSAPLPNLLLET